MKRSTFQTKAALTIALLTACASVSQAVVVTFGVPAPTTDIITSYTPAIVDGGIGWANIDDSPNPPVIRNIGQSFITPGSAFSMNAITMQLGNSPNFPSAVSFSIDFYKLGDPGQLPTTGTFLSTQTGTIQTTGVLAGSYFTFTLDTPVSLDANSSYAYVLSLTTTTGTGVIVLAIDEGAPDPAGTRVSQTNLNTVLSETAVYYIQGTAVPEPGTTMLFGLAAAGGLVVWRRSRVATRTVA